MPSSRATPRRDASPVLPLRQSHGMTPGRDTSRYIASMASELLRIAHHNHMPMVAYFLDMARIEAEAEAQSSA